MKTQIVTADYLTLTEIGSLLFGKALRKDRARLAYAAERFGIEPARRAGAVRLWHRSDIPRFQDAIDQIASRPVVLCNG